MRRNRPQHLEPSWSSKDLRDRPPTPYPFTRDGFLRSCFLGQPSSPSRESRISEGYYRHVAPGGQRTSKSSRTGKLSYAGEQHRHRRAISAANAEIDRRPAVPRHLTRFPVREEKHVRFKLPSIRKPLSTLYDESNLEQAMMHLDIQQERRNSDRNPHCKACGRRIR